MSSELTELADKLDDAEGSYNLVRRVAVEVASALRTLSSQEKQEPVAWQQLINEKWCNLPEDWSEAECLKIPPGKTFRGLYTAPQKPQPAPGWDEAIDACKAIAKQHVEDIVKNSLAGEWVAQGIFDAIEALSHQPAPVERDPLDDLVARFSNALLKKLKLAQANGRSGWEKDDWEVDCQRGLLRHVEKGDPRDVAAYCAFMWHHGWITARPAPVAADASAEATYRIGRWLSAALEDPNVCSEMKSDINAWMEAGKPNVQPSGNASAEARLRTFVQSLDCECDSYHGHTCARCKALSAHPHASDCDKQGETTKSEGLGLAQAGTAREAPGSATGCLQHPNTQVDARPSDRTADVTADELRKWLLKHVTMPTSELARALLDAYGMRRR